MKDELTTQGIIEEMDKKSKDFFDEKGNYTKVATDFMETKWRKVE